MTGAVHESDFRAISHSVFSFIFVSTLHKCGNWHGESVIGKVYEYK